MSAASAADGDAAQVGNRVQSVHMNHNRWIAGAMAGALALACFGQAPRKRKNQRAESCFRPLAGWRGRRDLHPLEPQWNAGGHLELRWDRRIPHGAGSRRTIRRRRARHGQPGRLSEGRAVFRRPGRPLRQPHRPRPVPRSTARLSPSPRTTATTRCTAAPAASTSTSGTPAKPAIRSS